MTRHQRCTTCRTVLLWANSRLVCPNANCTRLNAGEAQPAKSATPPTEAGPAGEPRAHTTTTKEPVKRFPPLEPCRADDCPTLVDDHRNGYCRHHDRTERPGGYRKKLQPPDAAPSQSIARERRNFLRERS